MSLRCNLIALRLNFTEEQGLPSPVASSPRRITITYFESSCGGEQYNQWIRPHTNLSWQCCSGKTHKNYPWRLFSRVNSSSREIAVANSPTIQLTVRELQGICRTCVAHPVRFQSVGQDFLHIVVRVSIMVSPFEAVPLVRGLAKQPVQTDSPNIAHIPGIFGLLSEQPRRILHYKGTSGSRDAHPPDGCFTSMWT